MGENHPTPDDAFLLEILCDYGLSSDFLSKLADLDKDDLTKLLAGLAQRSEISPSEIERARISLPSFYAKWSDLSHKFGWNPKLYDLHLEPFHVPLCTLPLSFHASYYLMRGALLICTANARIPIKAFIVFATGAGARRRTPSLILMLC